MVILQSYVSFPEGQIGLKFIWGSVFHIALRSQLKKKSGSTGKYHKFFKFEPCQYEHPTQFRDPQHGGAVVL